MGCGILQGWASSSPKASLRLRKASNAEAPTPTACSGARTLHPEMQKYVEVILAEALSTLNLLLSRTMKCGVLRGAQKFGMSLECSKQPQSCNVWTAGLSGGRGRVGTPPLGVRCPIGPGRAHRGPRPGWAVTRRRLGADRARRHVLIGINSPTRGGPRREGPSATVPQPLSPSSSFSRHHPRHMASHSQGEVASLTATPLSRDPCRFGFFTVSDQQLINVYS